MTGSHLHAQLLLGEVGSPKAPLAWNFRVSTSPVLSTITDVNHCAWLFIRCWSIKNSCVFEVFFFFFSINILVRLLFKWLATLSVGKFLFSSASQTTDLSTKDLFKTFSQFSYIQKLKNAYNVVKLW
jgi:hypothetical protein